MSTGDGTNNSSLALAMVTSGGAQVSSSGWSSSNNATAATNTSTGSSSETPGTTGSEAEEAVVHRTKGHHKSGAFRWIIDDYLHLPQTPKKRTFTKKFNLCGHQWRLSVTPGGEKSKCEKIEPTEMYMSVYLWYHGKEEIETTASIQLIDLNERPNGDPIRDPIQYQMTPVMGPYDDESHGISRARGWAEFARGSDIRQFSKNDRIVLELKLKVRSKATHLLQDGCATPTSSIYQRSTAKFRSDFQKLYHGGEYADVNFVVGEYEFPAHKAIIAIRSPVLAAMFAHATVEASSGRIVIQDVQAGIFAEILKYIYLASCSFKHPELLLAAADRFALPELCEICAVRLMSSLTIANVTDRLILAHDHSVVNLKQGCLTFMREHAHAVINSSGYKRLRKTRPGLPAQILEAMFPFSSSSSSSFPSSSSSFSSASSSSSTSSSSSSSSSFSSDVNHVTQRPDNCVFKPTCSNYAHERCWSGDEMDVVRAKRSRQECPQLTFQNNSNASSVVVTGLSELPRVMQDERREDGN